MLRADQRSVSADHNRLRRLEPCGDFRAGPPIQSSITDQAARFAVSGLLSLIPSAKLNRFDPEAYLKTALASIADYPAKKIADLPPWGDAFNSKTA